MLRAVARGALEHLDGHVVALVGAVVGELVDHEARLKTYLAMGERLASLLTTLL